MRDIITVTDFSVSADPRGWVQVGVGPGVGPHITHDPGWLRQCAQVLESAAVELEATLAEPDVDADQLVLFGEGTR